MNSIKSKSFSSGAALKTTPWILLSVLLTCCSFSTMVDAAHRWSINERNFGNIVHPSINKKSKSHYEIDDMEQVECEGYNNNSLMGSGREWNIFDSRGGAGSSAGDTTVNNEFSSTESSSLPFLSSRRSSLGQSSASIRNKSNSSDFPTAAAAAATRSGSRSNASSRRYGYSRSSNGGISSHSSSTAGKRYNKSILTNIKEWIQAGNLPKIQCRVEPNTTLKVRKTFRPLKTVVRLGADFNTQLGVWQFKSSWEDDVIGGKLTLAGRELQFSKTWLLSVGAVEDLVTRLRFRAAVDLGTMKAYARLGFRTERLSPINVVEGFTLRKRLPLDGNDGHVKLEVKANFAFPEPEIEYSTENHRSFVGMGDIEVNIDELNLLLDY